MRTVSAVVVATFFLFGIDCDTRGEQAPNIILLLADDLGYSGLGCYGSDLHETPHLDALAARGMKFTSAYSACTVCSPTRASIMTGKYPARLHLTDFIAGQKRPYSKLRIPDWTKRLKSSEITIAERLKDAGYATAQVGKWHLEPRGENADGCRPTDQGFDVSISRPPRTRGYFIPKATVDAGHAKSRYLTDHLTDEAVRLIGEWKDKPFFLYFAYNSPHTPIQGRADLVAKYEKKSRSGLRHSNPVYAAMVESLDQSAGRVLAKLEETGIASRTIVVFCSDNGGLSRKFGRKTGFIDNHPLRRGKGSAYEGGTRVPMIAHWPGVTAAGSVCDEPVTTIDFLPTFLELAGLPLSEDDRMDGMSLVGLLRNAQSTLDRDALYWHYPHYHAGGDGPYGAIRARRWKLIEFFEDRRFELYDLNADIGEATNLADEHPEQLRRLRDRLHQWRESVGAQMPTDNPDFDPDRAAAEARGEKVK